MIVKITQTASDLSQAYDVEGDGFYYHAKAGSLSWIQPITLSNSKNTIKGHFHLCKWVNYIPFRHLFGAVNLSIRGVATFIKRME